MDGPKKARPKAGVRGWREVPPASPSRGEAGFFLDRSQFFWGRPSAAGGAEAVFTVLAIRDQVAPPTINLDNPDEGCDLNFVPHQAQEMPINWALSNSFGFGGTNGSLLFKRFE